MKKPILISAGTDEWHLLQHIHPDFKELFKQYPTSDSALANFALSDDTVIPRLKAALKSSLLPERPICVIRDAEVQSADVLWQKLILVFREAGYSNLPDRLPRTGLILNEESLHRVGVWIMPNNEDAGMIEDFYLRAIRRDDRELGLAKTFVISIPKPLFKDKISKSVYRVWLAIQSDPVGPAQALAFQQISRDAGDIPIFI